MQVAAAPSQASLQPNLFDARGVAKRFRHAAIFGALESLHDGESMRFVNDHDPLPLLNQINERYRGQVRYQYVQRDENGVVIDFAIDLAALQAEPPAAPAASTGGGCGGGGSGCGCSGA